MNELERKPRLRLRTKLLLTVLALLLVGGLVMAAFLCGLSRGGREAEPVITD